MELVNSYILFIITDRHCAKDFFYEVKYAQLKVNCINSIKADCQVWELS